MKKFVTALLLVLILVLGLGCAAHALTQEDIQGEWQADMQTVLDTLGITADQYEMLKTIGGEMTIITEFTADRRCIMKVDFAGETEKEEFSYELFDKYLIVNGGESVIVLMLEGDTLCMTESDDFEMTFIRKGAAVIDDDIEVVSAPALSDSQSVVGVWDIDVEAAMQMIGMSNEEYDAIQPFLNRMSVTIEFTADGRMIMRSNFMGQEDVSEEYYEVKGNQIFVDGEPKEYVIEGNTMTLTEDGSSRVLTRHTSDDEEEPAVPVLPPEATIDGAILGEWEADYAHIMAFSGLSDEEYTSVEPFFGMMSASMEFTADGRLLFKSNVMGQEQVNEETFRTENNVLYVAGDQVEYTIEGDTLSMVIGGETFTLTRMK